MPKLNPLKPTASLLVKLGSIIVHAEELSHPAKGHVFDRYALDTLTGDPEVVEWRTAMDEMALLPVKR